MDQIDLSRRQVLKAGAAGALLVGCRFAGGSYALAAGNEVLDANAFVRIGSDDSVTVIAKHLEMGQGSWTGLATIVAEELDADWAKVKVEGAPADARRYNNLNFGPMQGTGGSSSMANSWMQLRQAGAGARTMLVNAAAARWSVPASEISVSHGVVTHKKSGKHARFGELAGDAAKMQAPKEVALKDPKTFTLIGKHAPRKDSIDKTTGHAKFTQDVQLPGMLVAVVAHSPRFGGKVARFDDAEARKVRGVSDVVSIGNGVAVLAKSFWAAKKGRDALKVEWDDAAAYKQSSADQFAEYRAKLDQAGVTAATKGDSSAALLSASTKIRADYQFPYLAHAAMEPMNCVIARTADGVEVWNGEQFQTLDQVNLAGVFGIKPEQVKINMLYAGGSFGRRANPVADYILECARIVKAIDGRAPVKMVWTREDDMRAGYYRPAYVHRIEAGLDGNGKIAGWKHRIVGQSIGTGTPMEGAFVKDGVDFTSVEGAANIPYDIADFSVDLHTPHSGAPVLWWRSVGSTHTGYAVETAIDELAAMAKKDPVDFRLDLLKAHPRHIGVLKLAADKAGWHKPLSKGKAGERRGRGVAVVESFNTHVAQVAEVTIAADGSIKVDRVVCAVDCGIAINPDVVVAQMQGGIGFALSAALYGSITLKDGVVEQGNFHEYQMLRINEMPHIEVHIVPSAQAPTGVGEPGVPPLAPAVANAIAAATGQRLRTLPFKLT